MIGRAFLASALLAMAAQPAEAAYALYHGTIGKQPVTMLVQEKNAVLDGVYFYDRHRTPIRLKPAFTFSNGAIDELDADGVPAARLKIAVDASAFHGSWTDYRTGKALAIGMIRTAYSVYDAEPVPIMQAASTERFFFVIPSVATGRTTAIEVHDKATGSLVQTLVPPAPACEDGIDTVRMETGKGGAQIEIAPKSYCPGARFALDAVRDQFENVQR